VITSWNADHTESVVSVVTETLNTVPSVSDNMNTDMTYYNYDSEFGEWFIVEPPAPLSNTYGQQAVNNNDPYGFTDSATTEYIDSLSKIIDVFDIDAFRDCVEEFIDTRDWDDRHFLYKGKQLRKVAGAYKAIYFRRTPPANRCLYIKRKRRTK